MLTTSKEAVVQPYVGIFVHDSVMYLVQILADFVLKYVSHLVTKINKKQQTGLSDIDLVYRKCIMLLCSWTADQWTQEYNNFLQQHPQAQDYYQYVYVLFAKEHASVHQQTPKQELTIPTFRVFFCAFVKRCVKSYHVRQFSFINEPLFNQVYIFSGVIRQLLSDYLYNVTFTKVTMVDTVPEQKQQSMTLDEPETPKVHNFTLDVDDNIIHDEVVPENDNGEEVSHQPLHSGPPSPRSSSQPHQQHLPMKNIPS